MEITNYFISFIIGALFTLIVFFISAITKDKKPKNKVHFYVARDMDGTLWLYMGKPVRGETEFIALINKGVIAWDSNYFEYYNLNKKDYDNLKWEDEPVEVFINMGD